MGCTDYTRFLARDLVLRLESGEVRFQKATIYERTPDGRREIAGGFVLRGRQVGFRVGAHLPPGSDQ